jgi:hypothetical protein
MERGMMMMMMMVRMYWKEIDVYTTALFSFFLFYDSMFVSNNTISLCDKSTRGREKRYAIFIG